MKSKGEARAGARSRDSALVKIYNLENIAYARARSRNGDVLYSQPPIFVRRGDRVYKAANRRTRTVRRGGEGGGGPRRGTTATTITAKDF